MLARECGDVAGAGAGRHLQFQGLGGHAHATQIARPRTSTGPSSPICGKALYALTTYSLIDTEMLAEPVDTPLESVTV